MANHEQLTKLNGSVPDWNQWRAENSELPIDLIKADLRDGEYPGIDFHDANLSKANFRDGILTGANLTFAVLTNSNLTGVNLSGANLSGANGENVTFNMVDASGVDLTGSEIKGQFSKASFIKANLSAGIFKDSNFSGSDFTNSDLIAADFRDSNLSQANFLAASLQSVDFRRSQLGGASFKLANLSKARMNGADLTNSDFTDAILTAADIRGVRGLTCDRLIKAKDWDTTYRDEDLACGADIPVKETTSNVVYEPTIEKEAVVEAPVLKRDSEGRIVLPLEAESSSDEIFGSELSHWRDDIDKAELRTKIEDSRNALTELENALTEIRNQPEPEHGNIGHNNPPEPLVPDLVRDQFVSEIRAVIALHDAPRPEKGRFSRLRDMLGRFRDWLQPRIDIAADAAAESFGEDIGHGLFALVAAAMIGLGALILLMVS